MSPIKIDLSNAKEQSFEPLPAGTYDATVFEVKMAETKGGPDAALPGGTPMLKVQFKINDESGTYDNRRVFTQLVIPPQKINGEPYAHYQTMMDNVFTFLRSVGYDESELRSMKALPDLEEMAGRDCRVVLKVREYKGEQQNEVRSVKPAGSGETVATGGLAGL